MPYPQALRVAWAKSMARLWNKAMDKKELAFFGLAGGMSPRPAPGALQGSSPLSLAAILLRPPIPTYPQPFPLTRGAGRAYT